MTASPALLHVAALRKEPVNLGLEPGSECILVPGCKPPLDKDILFERPRSIFQAAARNMAAMLDDLAEQNRGATVWLHCSDFLVKRHRSPVFQFLFLLEVVRRHGASRRVVLHCDESHLYRCASNIDALRAELHGAPNARSSSLASVGKTALEGVRCYLRQIVGLVKRWKRDKTYPDQRTPSTHSDVLILTYDTYPPWNETSEVPDRVWGDLNKHIRADFGVLHRVSPEHARHAGRHGASSIFLTNSLNKLLRSATFRTTCLVRFLLMLSGRKCPDVMARHMDFFGPHLMSDLCVSAPHWRECHTALTTFLRRNPQYKTLLYFGEFYACGRMALLAGKKTGRNALAYAHGIYYESHLQLRITKREKELYHMPDVYLLYSRHTLRTLHRHAQSMPRVCIVGQSRFRTRQNKERKDPPRGVIGLMMSTADYPSLLKYVVRHAAALRDFTFLLKPHPTRLDEIKGLDAKSLPVRLRVFQGHDPQLFFDQIDVLAVGCSTGGAEALGHGVPVVVVGESVSWDTNTLTRHAPHRGVFIADTHEKFAEACRLFVHSPPDSESMWKESRFHLGEFRPERIRALIDYLNRRSPHRAASDSPVDFRRMARFMLNFCRRQKLNPR